MRIFSNMKDGALLNSSSRFFDQRLGQSTTLTGRTITKHMCSKTNEMITGEYNEYGESNIYSDTDSVAGDTIIHTTRGDMKIEDLFLYCAEKYKEGDKEYSYDSDIMVMSYDNKIDEPYFGHIDYVYRHKVSKEMYEIEDELGNIVHVTEDHSIMVERDGCLIEARPADILDSDILLSLNLDDK